MLVRARGREYFYHQRNRGTKRAGPRTLLAGCPFNPDGSPNDQWWTAYRQLEGVAEPAARAGSFHALIEAREISPEWATLSENTRTEWKRYHGIIAEAWGHLDVKALQPKHVKALRDKVRRHSTGGPCAAHEAVGGIQNPSGCGEQSAASSIGCDRLGRTRRMAQR